MSNENTSWWDLRARERHDPPPREEGTYLEDRSTITMRIMEKYSKAVQKGLVDIDIQYNHCQQ